MNWGKYSKRSLCLLYTPFSCSTNNYSQWLCEMEFITTFLVCIRKRITFVVSRAARAYRRKNVCEQRERYKWEDEMEACGHPKRTLIHSIKSIFWRRTQTQRMECQSYFSHHATDCLQSLFMSFFGHHHAHSCCLHRSLACANYIRVYMIMRVIASLYRGEGARKIEKEIFRSLLVVIHFCANISRFICACLDMMGK